VRVPKQQTCKEKAEPAAVGKRTDLLGGTRGLKKVDGTVLGFKQTTYPGRLKEEG